MAADEEPDEVLFRRAGSGDRDAFKVLYLRHSPATARFVARRCPQSEVDDVVADTFVRVWQALPRYEWRGAPALAWILRIASRMIIDHARRRSNQEVVSDECTPPPAEDFADGLISGMASRQRISELLSGLNAQQRSVIILRQIDDLSVAETAALLEMSPEAVRACTHRALRNLRAVAAGRT